MASKEQIQKRRKLIKAGMGIPAVFSLPRGAAAQAMTSVMCIDRDGNVITGFELVPITEPGVGGSEQVVGVAVRINGQDYIPQDGLVEIEGQTYRLNDESSLVASSCWNSMNPQATAAGAAVKIV